MSEISIQTGTKGHQTQIVEIKNTAKKVGSGALEVFSTPAMIALMEKTAFESIESKLPHGFSSVGTEIKTQHIKATLPGSIISCESEVIKVEGKKIYFTITASDEKGVIGKCEHTRYIINSKEFMDKLKE